MSLFSLRVFVLFSCFETESHFVFQAVLQLTMQIRLTSKLIGPSCVCLLRAGRHLASLSK